MKAAIIYLVICLVHALAYKPIVIWHGMGDSCCNPKSIGYLVELLEKQLPGVTVKSIRMGATANEDVRSSFIGSINDQVQIVCRELSNDSKLKGGFNAIGVSQGGLFLRAYVQTCIDGPQINNLITFGSPHGGVSEPPACENDNSLCQFAKRLIESSVYSAWVQKNIIQAQYFRDASKFEYFSKNKFLSEINAENENYNQIYKDQIKKLNYFVLIEFINDTMVKPKESASFGTYDADHNLIQFKKSDIFYKQDRLGLRVLYEQGRLIFMSEPGNHLNNLTQILIKKILPNYLTGTDSKLRILNDQD